MGKREQLLLWRNLAAGSHQNMNAVIAAGHTYSYVRLWLR